MNPDIDFLGICQLLKALRTVGFSENDIKRMSQKWNSDAEDARRPPVRKILLLHKDGPIR